MLGPAIRMAKPWKMPRVPSVAISGVDASVCHEQPVQEAAERPQQHPGGHRCHDRPAAARPSTSRRRRPTSDISDPTERSNTPPIISIIIPSARIPSTARLFRTTRRFAEREERRGVEDRGHDRSRGRSPGQGRLARIARNGAAADGSGAGLSNSAVVALIAGLPHRSWSRTP